MKSENTGKYISYLSRLILKYTTEQFSKYDLTSIEYMYLMILHERGTVSQKELSRVASVDKAQTTRAIKSLVAKMLVTKEVSEKDKRVSFISLSYKGKQLAPSIKLEIDRFEDVLNEGISKTDQRKMKMNLLKMISNMRGEMNE